MMPHSWLFGHLGAMHDLLEHVHFPSDGHSDYIAALVQENWHMMFPNCSRCPPIIYLDLWPFASPLLISINPEVSAQFTQDANIEKACEMRWYMQELTLNKDIISANGRDWLNRRQLLSVPFSTTRIFSQVPGLVKETETFVRVLRQKCGPKGGWGPVFRLQDAATNLMLAMFSRFALYKAMRLLSSPAALY
jgi:hypothetical protein